jgi:hypothetical protein
MPYSVSFLWGEYPDIPDENKWNLVRSFRNETLTRSDWTQLGDAPFTVEEKDAWTAYRQALRDVPQDFGGPDDVMFPDTPGTVTPAEVQA